MSFVHRGSGPLFSRDEGEDESPQPVSYIPSSEFIEVWPPLTQEVYTRACELSGCEDVQDLRRWVSAVLAPKVRAWPQQVEGELALYRAGGLWWWIGEDRPEGVSVERWHTRLRWERVEARRVFWVSETPKLPVMLPPLNDIMLRRSLIEGEVWSSWCAQRRLKPWEFARKLIKHAPRASPTFTPTRPSCGRLLSVIEPRRGVFTLTFSPGLTQLWEIRVEPEGPPGSR